MTTLFSLILVYLLHKYLGNYLFFKNLQNSCSSEWVDDLLFKFQMMASNFPRIPMMVALLLLLLLIGGGVILLRLLFYYTSYHLGLLIFNVLLLFYTLASARKKECASPLVAIFEHNLGILFWFTLLGQFGVILFWLCYLYGMKSHLNHQNNFRKIDPAVDTSYINIQDGNMSSLESIYPMQTLHNCLYTCHIIMAWLPARMVGLVFCLIGDFKKGFDCWKEKMRNSHMTHAEFLDVCGQAALGESGDDTLELLLERSFIAWLVVCIIIGLMI